MNYRIFKIVGEKGETTKWKLAYKWHSNGHIWTNYYDTEEEIEKAIEELEAKDWARVKDKKELNKWIIKKE